MGNRATNLFWPVVGSMDQASSHACYGCALIRATQTYCHY